MRSYWLSSALMLALAGCSSSSSGDPAPAADSGPGGTDTGTPSGDTGTAGGDTGKPGADTGTPGTDTGTPGTDTGTPPGDTATTGDVAGACNTVVNVGSPVSKTSDPGPVPAFTGGTILDGTYVLTAVIDYNGHSGSTVSTETLILSAGGTHLEETATEVSSGVSKEQRNTATLSASGSALTIGVTCPATVSLPAKFTATATDFRFLVDDPNEVHVFTKM